MKKNQYNPNSIPHSNRTSKFILSLYHIIQDHTFPHIISWSQDGKSFIISSPKLFQQEILPKYFKHNNMASFIRQLNMYNFVRKKCVSTAKEYMHKYFSRNEQVLLRGIVRKKQQKLKRNKLSRQKKMRKNVSQNDNQLISKQICELISFNRRLLQQNSLLWQLFFDHSFKLEQQQKISEQKNMYKELEQLIQLTQKVQKQQYVPFYTNYGNQQYQYQTILKQYKIVSQLVDFNIQGSIGRQKQSS